MKDRRLSQRAKALKPSTYVMTTWTDELVSTTVSCTRHIVRLLLLLLLMRRREMLLKH